VRRGGGRPGVWQGMETALRRLQVSWSVRTQAKPMCEAAVAVLAVWQGIEISLRKLQFNWSVSNLFFNLLIF
jgi:hypothetical protein